MFLPYASDFKPTKSPVITTGLIFLLSALTFLVTFGGRLGWTWAGAALLTKFGIVPAQFQIITLLTYLFFHEGVGHLIVNLFYLGTFGAGAEAALGRVRYLLVFMASGILGGALQVGVVNGLLSPDYAGVPIIGASAGCAGLVGVFAYRYYRSNIYFTGIKNPQPAYAVVTVFLAYEVISSIYNLMRGDMGAGVAHWAHIGGFMCGLGYARFLNLYDAGSNDYLDKDAKMEMNRNVPGEAIGRWETLLAREPNNATARSEMARAWRLLGDAEQAQAQFQQAIAAYIAQNKRSEAALLYAEMRESLPPQGLATRDGELTSAQLFILGGALEDLEQFPLAADTLRAVTIRAPETPEAETALLKVIALYARRLNRREEADVLLRLFREKYPHSPLRSLAEDLRRESRGA